MIETLISFLEVNILPLGFLGVFLASVIEEVVAPIPSALIMTMSGFLFVSGDLSVSAVLELVLKVALPAAFGVTLGSYFIYFIARFGGLMIIGRWGKYLGLYLADIENMKAKFSGTKKDEWLIVGARVLPIVPSVAISALCGILEMNIGKYFYLTLVGTFVRGIILGFIGWQVGNVYVKYAEFFSSIEKVILISTILVIIIFIVLKYRSNK